MVVLANRGWACGGGGGGNQFQWQQISVVSFIIEKNLKNERNDKNREDIWSKDVKRQRSSIN